MKNINGKISVILISLLLVLAACSNANNTPTPTQTAEVKETEAEEVVEEAVEEAVDEVNEPALYLQKTLDQTKTIETISYMSSVINNYYFHSNETNTINAITDYVFSMNGELRRSPAAAKIDTISSYHILEYDENGTNTFEDYSATEAISYLSIGEGDYYKSDTEDKWYQYYLSDDFKTLEHIEQLLNLFLLYPEQLTIIDEFGEGHDTDLAVIQYHLTNEQFVSLSPDFRKSFFTGVYDLTDIEYDTPKADEMNDLYLDITVDKDFNIYSYRISYTDKYYYDETANPEDFHGYSLSVYFNNQNEPFFGELPDEVREAAVSPY